MEASTFYSPLSSNDSLGQDFSTPTIAGSIYIVLGIFGIVENGFVAYLMATDPEMRSPSYYYMINLCTSDMCILLATYVYCGLALVFPYFLMEVMMRTFAYLTSVSWVSCVCNVILASFSRFIQMTRPHLMNMYFKKRNLIVSVVLAWLIPIIGYGILMATQFGLRIKGFYVVSYDLCTWTFDYSNTNGYSFFWITSTYNIVAIIVITYFNVSTLLCVRRMRAQIQNQIDTNQAREIKLFTQIALSCLFYAMCVIIFIVAYRPWRERGSRIWYVSNHLLWGLQHLHGPFVYMALNKRLRERAKKVFRWRSDGESENTV